MPDRPIGWWEKGMRFLYRWVPLGKPWPLGQCTGQGRWVPWVPTFSDGGTPSVPRMRANLIDLQMSGEEGWEKPTAPRVDICISNTYISKTNNSNYTICIFVPGLFSMGGGGAPADASSPASCTAVPPATACMPPPVPKTTPRVPCRKGNDHQYLTNT